MKADKKRKALGKGLGALLPEIDDTGVTESGKTYVHCPVEKISPNTYQPRKIFDDNLLSELVASIREKGVIQPLIVRENGADGYELIAGERRWRAARKAGLSEVPIIVKDVSDKESLEIAIVENIQRADLNPVEEALGYKRLADEFSYTQEEIALKVGKERTTITNLMRILRLPDDVKNDLASGALSLGHAKALLALDDNALISSAKNHILNKGSSVRETESYIKKIKSAAPPKKEKTPRSPDTIHLEDKLSSFFGTKVIVNSQGKHGKLEIEYYSVGDLDRIMELMGV